MKNPALALGLTVALTIATSAQTNSRVILVRDAAAVNGFNVDAVKVRAMVAAGITAIAGETAWGHFVSSNDIVGIKINTQPGPLQFTRHALVEAIVDGLRQAGVVSSNIYVFDRDPAKMRAAGYSKPDAVSVIDGSGWDVAAYFQNNLAGKLIWGDLLFGKSDEDLSKRSHLPKLVSQTITKLINVPVLQDHDACGLMGCLYNLSLGMVDNTRRFETNGLRGDPMAAEICTMKPLRDKLVLNIMDGLIAGYAGGPSFKPQYSWPYATLYFATDPVAIDALCAGVLDVKRVEAKVPALGNHANYIASAARLGLGQNDRSKIELIEIKP